jgi:hypothetical protein
MEQDDCVPGKKSENSYRPLIPFADISMLTLVW